MINYSYSNKILEEMRKFGLEICPSQIIFDGEIHRFGKNKSSWYVAHHLENGVAGAFGDWKMGGGDQFTNNFFINDKLSPSNKDWINLKKDYQKKKKEIKIRKNIEFKKKQKIMEIIFVNSIKNVTNNHPYLNRKNIPFPFKIREIHSQTVRHILSENNIDIRKTRFYKNEKLLVIPMYDLNTKKISSLQFIHENGEKTFFKGGKTKNTYFPLGNKEDIKKGIIYFTEGYATGMSIKKIIGDLPIVIAFSASNLLNVVNGFKKKYPNHQFVICADNDFATKPKIGISNPGLNYAKEAIKILNDSNIKNKLCFPQFKDEALYLKKKENDPDFKTPSDFNDLEIIEGMEMLEKQLYIPTEEKKQTVTTSQKENMPCRQEQRYSLFFNNF